MREILISIQPKWCELIARGKKTIEVRKSRPKIETPFKVHIYCTKAKKKLIDILKDGDSLYGETYHGKPAFIKADEGSVCDMWGKRQKVIGEFMCYDISTYETEFYPHKKQPIYEAITEWNAENEVWEAVASNCDTYRTNFLKSTCMCLEDFRAYLGVGEIPFYGWHISDLVIYDEPKELSEFWTKDTTAIKNCEYNEPTQSISRYCRKNAYWCRQCRQKQITRPPQSWCYVERKTYENV